MNTTTAFKKIAEAGYAINPCLMWSRVDIDSALEQVGVDIFERSALSDEDKEMMLSEFFDNVEDYIIGHINELMINYFEEKINNKEPLNVSQQPF